MLAFLISVLISLGVISNENEYQELSQQDQEYYENTIITEDYYEL